jgi:TetR/AcrR family transcriptional regulator of autoinduction and epiphytic fitness
VDKRIEKTRRVVLEAAIDVLSATGYAGFNMEAVADAAGVAKSTLYRHWRTKIALIAEALERLNVQPQEPLPTSRTSSRAQVVELLEHLVGALAASRIAPCIPALIEAAEHHAEVAAFLHDYSATRRATLEKAIEQGVDTGEFGSDVDPKLAALALSGAIFYRRLMSPDPFDVDQIPALVDLVLGNDSN